MLRDVCHMTTRTENMPTTVYVEWRHRFSKAINVPLWWQRWAYQKVPKSARTLLLPTESATLHVLLSALESNHWRMGQIVGWLCPYFEYGNSVVLDRAWTRNVQTWKAERVVKRHCWKKLMLLSKFIPYQYCMQDPPVVEGTFQLV